MNTQIEKCNGSDYPEKYLVREINNLNKGLENSNNKDENIARLSIINDLMQQNDYIKSYDEYINQMESRADSQLMFSIFAEPNTFTYKNIEQTPVDFQELKGNSLSMGNNTAVEKSTEFEITDYLLLVLVVVISVFLFCLERENGIYPLVRSTKKGRVTTASSKLMVAVIVTAFCTILFYTSNVLISGLYFGFGDMSRSIQSISIFMNCSLKLSIFEYISLWILGKIITLCVIVLLISLGFVVIKTSAKMYSIIVVVLGLEIFANNFIDGTSVFAFFKYVNIFYFLLGNNLFGKYLNVNIFSEPVNIITVWGFAMVLLSLVSISVLIIVFAKSSQTTKKFTLISYISALREKRTKISGNTKIYSGEAFKHYKTSLVMVVLIVLTVFAVIKLNDDLSIRFSDSSENAYNTYMEKLEGNIDEDTNSFLIEEQKYFDELKAKRKAILKDSTLTENDKESQNSYIDAILKSKGTAFNRIQEQKTYVTEKGKEINEQPALINDLVCKRLTEDTYREWLYFTLLMAVVIFSASNIFACEYKNKMANLLRSNYYGKGRLIFTKLCTVMVTSILAFTLVYLPYLINFTNTFGKGEFSIPLAFMSDFSSLTSSITVGEFILVLGLIHFALTFTVTALVSMLSLLLKNNILTMIVSSGLILIPCLVVMELKSVRMVVSFQNNNWVMVTLLILGLCVLLSTLSITVTSLKFSKKKWRKKYANS
jgi:hypothetical protein